MNYDPINTTDAGCPICGVESAGSKCGGAHAIPAMRRREPSPADAPLAFLCDGTPSEMVEMAEMVQEIRNQIEAAILIPEPLTRADSVMSHRLAAARLEAEMLFAPDTLRAKEDEFDGDPGNLPGVAYNCNGFRQTGVC